MKVLYVTRHFNHSGFIILDRLIKEGVSIQAVLLHKDNSPWRRPVVRNLLIYLYHLKCLYYRCKPLRTIASEERLARKNKIPIIWTESIKSDSFYADLKKCNPDIIVLGGGWHELIPERVFSFAPLGCINTHPSLLPEFRGTSITRWQVLRGVEQSGSTIHYVDNKFDTGGVLAQKAVEVSNNTSPQELFKVLGYAGADIMVPLLRKFEETGKQPTYIVDHNSENYAYFKKWSWNIEKLKINWKSPLRTIHFHVLANTQESYEYKGTYFSFQGCSYFLRKTSLERLNILQQKFSASLPDDDIYIYRVEDHRIYLCRKNDPHCLILDSLQKYDNYYRWRRSFPANKKLCLEVNTKFMYNE
jgi:methionyl-tRNA formyltransferase